MALGELLLLDELLLGELLLGELLLGDLLASLLPDELDGLELELAPPEAEPDAEPEPDFEGSVALGELDELLLPLDGEVAEEEPELGGVELALPLVLPLVLPLLPADLPEPLSWPQAARPKAKATASASEESFMCPPWLAIRKRAAKNGPGPSH